MDRDGEVLAAQRDMLQDALALAESQLADKEAEMAALKKRWEDLKECTEWGLLGPRREQLLAKMRELEASDGKS